MSSPRVAVLLNPLSGRVRRRPAAVRALARRIGADLYAEASDPEAVADFLAGLSLGPDDLLCVVAGDGTLHAALTALERRRPHAPWPALAAAPGGTTNMTVKDMGRPGSLVSYLEALGAWKEGLGGSVDAPTRRAPSPTDAPPDAFASGRFVTRPVLRIAVPGREPLAGMFFGAGAVSAGVDFFNRRLKPAGVPEAVGSPLAIARILLSLALGGRGRDRLAPSVVARVDGGPELARSALLLLASTLHRMIVGARPYWGAEDAPIHFTLADRDAAGTFRNLPRLALGRPGSRLTPERGGLSHNAGRILLRFDGPYIVDGELSHARAADGPLELTAPRAIRWWMP